MKRKYKKLSDEEISKVKIIKDFLPPPRKLFVKCKRVKITITLSQVSVDLFKQVAHEKQVPYQKLIGTLLDQYAAQYK